MNTCLTNNTHVTLLVVNATMDYYRDSLGYKNKLLIPYMYVGTVSTSYVSIICTEEMLTKNQFQLFFDVANALLLVRCAR